MSATDIRSFAEQFMDKLAAQPVRYQSNYNAPVSRSRTAPTFSKKAQVSIAEVTLRNVIRPSSAVVKLSRTEPTLYKLYKEGAALLGCPLDCVVLVQDGQVLQDRTAATAVSNAPSATVYVFDRREWAAGARRQEGVVGNQEFMQEFIELLEKYGVKDADYLAQQFVTHSALWRK